MNSFIRSYLALLCLAGYAAGCSGGGDAPTAPGPTLPRTTLTLDLGYIEVIEDCDGIEGDGDFLLDVWVDSRLTPNDHVYSSGSISLGPGGRTPVVGRRSYTVDAIDGLEFTVDFQAVELDKSIIGEVYRDDRLAIAVTQYRHRFSNGAWSGLGSRKLSLGSAGCRIDFSWSASAS